MEKKEPFHIEKDSGQEDISRSSSLEVLLHNALEEESAYRSDLDRLQFLLRAWYYGRNTLLKVCLEGQFAVLENLHSRSFPLSGEPNPGLKESHPQTVKVGEFSNRKEIKIPPDHQVKAE